jgi:hypothetical protein
MHLFLRLAATLHKSRMRTTDTLTHFPSTVLRQFRNGGRQFSLKRGISLGCLLCFCVFVATQDATPLPAARPAASPAARRVVASDAAPIAETISWIHREPRDLVQFEYDMTVRVRLLFFWVSKDDVGGGYIRRAVAKEDARLELFQVLFGSDPAKAPRAINRWGGGTEAEWHTEPVGVRGENTAVDDVTASAFFGFMKSSKGKSAAEMQAELKKEKEQGEHVFTGILSRADAGRAFSLVVPLTSDKDYNLREYDAAEPLMIEKLQTSEKPIRSLAESADCARPGDFLGSVAELMEQKLAQMAPERGVAGDARDDSKSAVAALCYVHDAQVNTLTVEHAELVKSLQVKINAAKGGVLANNSFNDLLQLDFVTTHKVTGKKVYFTLLVGTKGALRGVPVQIRYEPNWWFQVVLNLEPASSRLAVASK